MAEPPLRLAALTPRGLEVVSGPPDTGSEVYQGANGSKMLYSSNGELLVVSNEAEVTLFSCKSDTIKARGTCKGDADINFASLSPSGRYLVTHERSSGGAGGVAPRNLKVWDTGSLVMVTSFAKKGITEDSWPAIQFDVGESHIFFCAKDSVVCYDMTSDFSRATQKVKIEGVAQFRVGPGKRKALAAFVPESRGSKPAVAAVAEWSEGGTVSNRKQFFRAQRAKIFWNATGSHVLFQTLADFDATNQSYFGESRLYLLSADGRLDMSVVMDNETAIADAAWSPDSAFFVAIAGINPATAVLFDVKGKPLSKFASGAYNQVCWCPHSRFILLAGFGNMPGDIQLVEKDPDSHKCTKMGATRSECSVLVEWSPCGRFFMTASVAPRMRVDNRISVFTYYGADVKTLPYTELFAACWQPAPAGAHSGRGQSPERLKAVAESRKKGVDLTEKPKTRGYVPPNQRGRNGARESGVEGLDVEMASEFIKTLNHRPRIVEGAEDVAGAGHSKSASKNAKRRARKAAHGASAGDVEETTKAFGDAGLHDGSSPGGNAAGGGAPNGDAGLLDPAKRLRNLRKKHAKVLAAKDKQARGEALTPEQAASIVNEAGLLEEMRLLGAADI